MAYSFSLLIHMSKYVLFTYILKVSSHKLIKVLSLGF